MFGNKITKHLCKFNWIWWFLKTNFEILLCIICIIICYCCVSNYLWGFYFCFRKIPENAVLQIKSLDLIPLELNYSSKDNLIFKKFKLYPNLDVKGCVDMCALKQQYTNPVCQSNTTDWLLIEVTLFCTTVAIGHFVCQALQGRIHKKNYLPGQRDTFPPW